MLSFPPSRPRSQLTTNTLSLTHSYTEAIPILYAENTFSFTDLWTLIDFLTRCIPAAHAEKMRSLDLTWTLFYCPGHTLTPSVRLSVIASGTRGCGGGRHGGPAPHNVATWREVWSCVSSSLPGLRRVRLDLSDRWLNGGCFCSSSSSDGRPGGVAVIRLYDGDPKALWLEWLRPVGSALALPRGGRQVKVEGAVWCRLDDPGSVHAVIRGDGGEGGRRLLVVLPDGEEMEW
ncbi:uncharacterized protein BKCO1_1420001 [Diplodia corticola]|uniref:DUF7730 domain-containing protein n=1 Tax=Diplodia corticola TaxID=236234 RepID=A0A1J9QJH7_9PEZI|nr:uncharacterized protein BKCO1_1420001 [Diplodia corticola]OJD28617.1 hypothetical protein BKCO1_1420001 [Diplodia corticola]